MRRKSFVVLAAGVTFVLAGCLSPPPASEGENAAQPAAAPSAPINENSPEYQAAVQFDRYIKNQMPAEELAQVKASCRAHDAENPFCFSYRHGRGLEEIVDERMRVFHPGAPPVITPFTPDIRGGKIRDWTRTRKAKVQALLAGMSTATLDTLHLMATVALRERRCPNNAAVATAALMESYLAESGTSGSAASVTETIARLYEKGGNCARRRSYDREHFFTRSALFWILQKRYPEANKLLSKVEPRDAFSGRALFWLARVRQQLGNQKGAQQALRRLRGQHPFSFHSLLSYVAEGTDPLDAVQRPDSPPKPLSRSQRNARVNVLANQVEILKKYAFDQSAAMVVDWALSDFGSMEPEVRLYLASLGQPRTQVLTLQDILLHRPSWRNQSTLTLAFPKAYFDVIERQKSRVDPYLLLAVARKESILNPLAISPANAQGLLQLNPTTAQKLRPGEKLNLLDPATNADLAARYLESLLSMMKNQLPLVIASYNAGEDPVLRWVRRYPTSDQLLFIDLIPYRETRDYVGFVLSNYYWYHRLYTTNAASVLRPLVDTQLAKAELPDSTRAVKSVDVDKLLESSEFSGDDGASGAPSAIDPALAPSAGMGGSAGSPAPGHGDPAMGPGPASLGAEGAPQAEPPESTRQAEPATQR